jgi:flagella basal body P-ring formation protein FlgA
MGLQKTHHLATCGIAVIAAAILAAPLWAETLVASRTIRALSIIGPEDVAVVAETTPGALQSPAQALGQEAKAVLYAGRPIRPGDIGPPAVIERNQIVAIHYRTGGLVIGAEGRALGRAGVGEWLRVMNLDSRTTISGRVTADGTIDVANRP